MLQQCHPIINFNTMKARFLSSRVDKRVFSSSKAVLAVSVGQGVHEGQKLAATIALVNESFAYCDIAVCDTLQRHTTAITDNDTTEHTNLKTNSAGKAWIERNQSALQLLTIPHRILRWDEYLSDPDFHAGKRAIIQAYQEDKLFKNETLSTIQEFAERHRHRFDSIDPRKVFDGCFNYLLEESAVITFVWPKYRYAYIIYPSNILRIVQASLNKFVLPLYPELLKWLRLRVRTRPAYKSAVYPAS